MADTWKSVLGISEIRVHENLFDLGGTSLLLYRVCARLRNIRRDLRVVDLFRHTCIESLATFLAADSPQNTNYLKDGRSRAEQRRSIRARV